MNGSLPNLTSGLRIRGVCTMAKSQLLLLLQLLNTGSSGVRVTHDVVLVIPNNHFDDLYNSEFDAIQEAVTELEKCETDCVYDVTDTTVNKTEVDKQSVCEEQMGSAAAAAHYMAVTIEGIIICVTPCDWRYTNGKICKSKGVCKVYSDMGAVCECQNVNSTWYLGSDCDLPIHKTAFYAGLSVTLGLLLVTVVALTVTSCINRQKQTQKKDMKEKLVNQWLEEDVEWSRPKNPMKELQANYTNPLFTPNGYRGTPLQSLSPSAGLPPQQARDRYSMSFPDPAYSQPPGSSPISGGFSANLPMRTIRPEIRTSWDT